MADEGEEEEEEQEEEEEEEKSPAETDPSSLPMKCSEILF